MKLCLFVMTLCALRLAYLDLKPWLARQLRGRLHG